MAHDITGDKAMVYAGETPWHGLGTKLPRNGTWDEIHKAAGFYTAKAVPIYANVGGASVLVPDAKGIVRADKVGSDGFLATVGSKYEIIQFEDLARAGVTASQGVEAIWHTAGTLGQKGERGWLLAELPERFKIKVDGDPSEIRPFVLLTTAHDGSGSAILANVATRVVCRNTLGIALGERGGARWSIRHTTNAMQYLEEAGRAFRAQCARMEKFGQLANALARTRLKDQDFENALAVAVPIPDDGENHPRLLAKRDAIRANRENFTGVAPKIKGTAWGDIQAFTELLDWPKGYTGADPKRAESQALGESAVAKAAVFEVITQAVGLSLAGVRSAS